MALGPSDKKERSDPLREDVQLNQYEYTLCLPTVTGSCRSTRQNMKPSCGWWQGHERLPKDVVA